jgi:hypothetical protein
MEPTDGASPVHDARQLLPYYALLALAIAGALAWLGWGRALGWDEVEFTRATEWVRQGRVPFRDFWEHHTPLTWFLMAPWKALFQGPGTGTVLAMRWGQVTLWIGIFLGLNAWMKDQGLPIRSRLATQALLLTSPFFVLWALQYRIDVSGNLFVVLALLASARLDRSRSMGLYCGALLGLAVLANLRLAPLVGVGLLVFPWMDLGERRWRWRLGAQWIWYGFSLVAALLALYLALTDSGALWWQNLIVDNALTDRLVQYQEPNFGRVVLMPFRNQDLSGCLLILGGGLGLLASLPSFRRPGLLHQLALLQAANFFFVSRMKVNYPYHFQLVLLFMMPFLGECLEAFRRWRPGPWGPRLVLGAAGFQMLLNVAAFAEHRQSRLLAYQDLVMREADRVTEPGEKVLDMCGFALNREPAYRYWFLAVNIRVLSLSGHVDRYPLKEFRDRPPRAVIYNFRGYNWFREWPELGRHLVTHYLPRHPNLWLPGLSGRLDASHRTMEWMVPRSGDYLLAGSEALAKHPWFKAPLHIGLRGTNLERGIELVSGDLPAVPGTVVAWTLNGKGLPAGTRRVSLKQGDRLNAELSSEGPVGLFVVDAHWPKLFEEAPLGVHMDELFFDYYKDDR